MLLLAAALAAVVFSGTDLTQMRRRGVLRGLNAAGGARMRPVQALLLSLKEFIADRMDFLFFG